MNVTKEQIDDLNAVIRFEIENKDYESRVESVLKDYRKKVNMPGFRPGRVPAGLVKKMYGKAILADEINKLVSEKLSKYIADNDLNILGEPLPSESQKTIDFDQPNHFEFLFDIGLAPDLDVKLTKRDKLPVYELEITDEMVEDQKKSLLARFGKSEPREEVTEKSTLLGDFVQLDQEGNPLDEGVRSEDSTLAVSVVKDEALKGEFIGKHVGDTLTFDLKKAFPNDTELSYLLKVDKEQVPEIGGEFAFTIKEIEEYVDPELNQELYNQLFGEGEVTSEEEFTQRVREDLERNFALETEYRFSVDARDKLMSKVDVPLPEEFLKRWIKISNRDNEEITDEKVDAEMPDFLKGLRWQLIRNEIIKANDLKIENEDVLNYARKAARAQFMQYGLNNIPENYLEQYVADSLKNEEQQRKYAEGAINDKVMEFIKESVKTEVKTVNREEFNKLFEENQ